MIEARLERLDREIEALAPQIEAANAAAERPGASSQAAKHYDNLVAEKKQLIASRDTLQAQLLSATAVQTSAALLVSPQLVSARARTACRYVGYMVGTDGRPRAVVTLNQRIVITYAHGDNLQLTEGTRVEVFINNCEGDKPAPTKAAVKLTRGQLDLVILEVSGQGLEPPALDADVRAGEPIITVAYSSTAATSRQGHGTPAPEDQVFISVSHGSIATSAPDKHGRIRSDTRASPGDSGGGVFSLETGKLIGMSIGLEKIQGANGQYKDGFKSLMVPVTAVLALLSS